MVGRSTESGSRVKAWTKTISDEQRKYHYSRQETRLGHKLESATEHQEQAESNKAGSEQRSKPGIRSQVIGAHFHLAIFLTPVQL